MTCFHKKHINPLIFNKLNGKNWNIKSYIKRGGYKSLKKILYNKISPEKIIDFIKKSKLRGRGGAGFYTGLKWSFIDYNFIGQKYIICNGDEGEPGTFKDYDIIMNNPHSIIEGMIIGAYAMNINKGYHYIHGEIFNAYIKFKKAIKEAYKYNFLGKNILNTNLNFELYIFHSYGSYICGEETALLESIEGNKPQPRYKPPFPANIGLYNKPTIINNVETFANIPFIFKIGIIKFINLGSENNGGTKIFSISGDICYPGNYEVPLGTSIKKIIKISGGIKNNEKIKAIIPGGSSTSIIKMKKKKNFNMDYDNLIKLKSSLGSGAIIILNKKRCMFKILFKIFFFYFKESCGKCTPCREGTSWIYKIFKKIKNGLGNIKDLQKIKYILLKIQGKTICAFGDAFIIPIRSFIKNFYKEFKYHIKYKSCLLYNCI